MLAAEFTGGYSGFGLAENTDDLLVGKTLLHGDVLMWLMKTLLISGCTNQRGAGHLRALQHPAAKKTTAKAQKSPEAKEGEYLAGNDENVFALTTVYATQKAAMRAAQAKWDKLQRGVAQFSISLARGRADLFPETPLAVSGFKAVIDAQPWIISKVTHSLNNGGYTTGLELEVLLSDVSYEATENN